MKKMNRLIKTSVVAVIFGLGMNSCIFVSSSDEQEKSNEGTNALEEEVDEFLDIIGANDDEAASEEETMKNEEVAAPEKTEEAPENKDEASDKIANSNGDHLKFKGVPIDGTLKEFVSRMQQKGFKLDKSETEASNKTAVLWGDFAGFKDCKLYVHTLQNKDLVSYIVVQFQDRDQWKFLYDDYSTLKNLLAEKYGDPSSCVEEFEYYKGIRLGHHEDNDKFYDVKRDRCNYKTIYSTGKGDIEVSIEHRDNYYVFVVLKYKDKINGEEVKEHALDDL